MLKFLLVASLLCSTAFANVNIRLTEANSISFNQPVGDMYVASKQLELILKHAKLPMTQPLYLVLDTPGGSVTDGLLFIDSVKSLNRPVHTITIFAASMGYQIVQELGTRYIIPSGTLMSHRGAVSGMSGQVPGELNARLGHIQDMLQGMNDRAARRIGSSVFAYQQSIINELWISGQNAVNKKHADFLADVTCDNSLLDQVYVKSVNTLFGPVDVTYSKCPIISAPISFKFEANVNPSNQAAIKKLITNGRKKIKLTF